MTKCRCVLRQKYTSERDADHWPFSIRPSSVLFFCSRVIYKIYTILLAHCAIMRNYAKNAVFYLKRCLILRPDSEHFHQNRISGQPTTIFNNNWLICLKIYSPRVEMEPMFWSSMLYFSSHPHISSHPNLRYGTNSSKISKRRTIMCIFSYFGLLVDALNWKKNWKIFFLSE